MLFALRSKKASQMCGSVFSSHKKSRTINPKRPTNLAGFASLCYCTPRPTHRCASGSMSFPMQGLTLASTLKAYRSCRSREDCEGQDSALPSMLPMPSSSTQKLPVSESSLIMTLPGLCHILCVICLVPMLSSFLSKVQPQQTPKIIPKQQQVQRAIQKRGGART